MAVAVATDALGSTEKKSEIRGNFVINPNTPTFVAPGDEFEISASIANNVKGSGDNSPVTVQLTSTPELEIIGAATINLEINEGQEKTAHFRLRATSTLGSAFRTSIVSGTTNDSKKELKLERSLYPEYRQVEAALSSSPLILVAGLQRYLDGYPYGCTEQLTSEALPLLAMTGQSWFVNDAQAISAKIAATIQMLGQRQMSNGGFSYWPGLSDNSSNSFASVYAMHFLTEARLQNYNVPNELFSAGLGYLRDLAGQTPSSMEAARIQAYAIYVLTRNEIVTTNYLTNLQLYLERERAMKWQEEITGAYIAATYQLLQSSAEANRLIGQYKPHSKTVDTSDFYDANIADAQYLYLVARHFPNRLAELGDKLVINLVNAINSAELNTVLSGFSSMALSTYGQANPPSNDAVFSIKELFLDNKEKTLTALDNRYERATIDDKVKQIIFNNPNSQTYFYQLIQAGFDKQLPTQAVKEGIEIYREFRDTKGNAITSTTLGTEIEVHIQVRSLTNPYLSNIAIVDLLPGGFEVVRDSVGSQGIDYADVREDRVVFFTSLDTSAKEIVYRIKATNIGNFTVPAIQAESMYDPGVRANSAAGSFEIKERT
jgi:uncharacterized protein YfaS (alpha-2-macroglobulin family)